MTDEAAKVINLSLCKIAESRSVRRGTSLHKHLLIASVLNKARSAYIENLYSEDRECVGTEEPPTLTPLPSISTFTGITGQNSSISFDNTDSCALDDESNVTTVEMIDPSFFVEVEGDIELPSDILSCVEKLTHISSEDMRFLNENEQEKDKLTGNHNSNDHVDYICLSSPEASFNDSGIDSANSSVSELLSSSFTSVTGPLSTKLRSTKRRRSWSFEDDYEEENSDADDEGYSEQYLPQELNDRLKKNGISVIKSTTKRRRMTKSASEHVSRTTANSGDIHHSAEGITISTDDNKENDSRRLFRTKKAVFDADEVEESEDEDDSFLDDDFENTWSAAPSPFSKPMPNDGNGKNDRRVPSASSGSDEEIDEGSSAMEVDQITSLVKYFTFKQQANSCSSSPSCPPSSPTLTPKAQDITESTVSGFISSGLTRSVSTPDLYSIRKSKELTSNLVGKNHNSNSEQRILETFSQQQMLSLQA